MNKFGNKYKEHLEDIFDNKKLNNDISYYLHRPSATDKSMAPGGHDCFYVLVPVPNNQSRINWETEGEKMKNLVIDKIFDGSLNSSELKSTNWYKAAKLSALIIPLLYAACAAFKRNPISVELLKIIGIDKFIGSN